MESESAHKYSKEEKKEYSTIHIVKSHALDYIVI